MLKQLLALTLLSTNLDGTINIAIPLAHAPGAAGNGTKMPVTR